MRNARFERLFDGGFFLDGPAVAPDGSVHFSDLTHSRKSGLQAGHIGRHDPQSVATAIFRSPSGKSNGIAFERHGDMIVAEGADFGGRHAGVLGEHARASAGLAAATHDVRSLHFAN